MSQNIEFLVTIIEACLFVAAFFTNLFPFLYLFSPWYSTKLGRVLMLQAVSFAVLLDIIVILQVFQPESILVRFWLQAFMLSFVAVASAALTWMLWRTNHSRWSFHRSTQKRSNHVGVIERVRRKARGFSRSGGGSQPPAA